MRTFILIIIIACLIQTSLIPLNLVLLLLISRTLVISGRSNLYTAFFAGAFLGLLTSVNLGFYPLTFLVVITLTQLIKRSPLSDNILTVVPICLLMLILVSIAELIFLKQTINFGALIWGGLVSLPIYLAVRFWEERFVVAPPLKLKV